MIVGNPEIVAEAKNRQDHIQLSLKHPNLKYISEFLGLTCAVDILQTDLFPNGKEITETMATYSAVVRKMHGFDPTDDEITMISVGDGSTPRTAGFFAYMTHWECISVDPKLRVNDFQEIRQLEMYDGRIQEYEFKGDRVILTAVHSHADLQDSVDAIDAEEILVVAMPCCETLELDDHEPIKEYADWGCFSPQRTIKIYHIKN